MDAAVSLDTLVPSEPGIYPDLPRLQYERIQAVNYSLLKHFGRSPAHARQEMLHPKEPTDAMELGTAVHMAILEPERFRSEYVRAPQCDRRTKEGKALWAEFELQHRGRNYLTPEEWELCDGMQQAAQSHQLASQLLYGAGSNELTAVWTDAETGLLCRARLDRFTRYLGWSFVVDVKSTVDASPDGGMARQVARLDYHVQVAFYLDGLATLAPVNRRFLIVGIENAPPHCIAIHELDEPSLAEGRRCYRRYLTRYAECVKTGVWPGYESGIWPLHLPRWAMKGETDDE